MKPAVLIIPGAWQLASAFQSLELALLAAGFPAAHSVSLPTVGASDCAATTLADDVAAVRTALAALVAGGHARVLIYAHSYGGIVASNAVGQLQKTSKTSKTSNMPVVGIVFASAFVIPSGRSLLDMLDGKPLPWMVVQPDRIVGSANFIPQVAFNDLDDDETEIALTQMTWTALSAFTTPSEYEPWTNSPFVQTDYLFAALDNALPLPMQQAMAAMLPAGSRTTRENTGHCAHLSRPGRVAEILASWYDDGL